MRKCGRQAVAVVAACAVWMTAGSARAQLSAEKAFGPVFGAGESNAPVAFSGDEFVWDRNTNVLTGTGHIEVEQGTRTLRCDSLRLFLDRRVAELEGDVAISQEGQTVYGDAATYDFVAQAGTFEHPTAFVDPWYVQADDIVREGPATYRARNATITTCDPAHPAWTLGVGDLEVDQETNTVRGTNVVARAGRVPVMYIPAYSQRLDRKQPPIEYRVGYDGDVGAFARLGFPLDVIEGVELTPRVDLFSESGIGGGFHGEGRILDDTTFDTDMFYISDRNKGNYDDEGVTQDRYKVDWYSRTTFPDDWVAMTQAEWWSDPEVVKTFFWDEYREREIPESFIDLTRTKPHSVFEVTATKRLDDFTQTLDELPRVSLDVFEYRLFDSPVFVSGRVEGKYSERKPQDDHLNSAVGEVRFSAPHRVSRWLNTVPFVQFAGRYHGAGNFGTREEAFDAYASPGIILQSRMHRVFDSPLPRYTRMRHVFEPTVTYAWRSAPKPDVEDTLVYDRSELFLDENRVELELRNKVQGRRPDGTVEDFLEYSATVDTDFLDGSDHLARLENELVFRPAERWRLIGQSVNDFREESRASSANVRLTYTDPRGISAFTGVVYTDPIQGQIQNEVLYGLAFPLGKNWRVGFEHRYREDESRIDQQEYWIWRKFDCWEIALSVRDRRQTTTVFVEVGLTAFPNRGFRHYRDESLLADCGCEEAPGTPAEKAETHVLKEPEPPSAVE